MIRARIQYRKPTSWAQYSRRLGKVLRSKDTDYEIDGAVTHRPFGPQIRDGKREHPPPPRSLSRRISGNVEANTDDRRWERFGDLRKMMSRARTRIQDAPFPEHSLGIAMPKVLCYPRRNGIEMACVEECCPIPQLLRAIASRRRLASSAAQ
jgi:hypothetical protein